MKKKGERGLITVKQHDGSFVLVEETGSCFNPVGCVATGL